MLRVKIGGLVGLALAFSFVLAEGPDPRQSYLEVMDDGPGAFRAVDDPLARSPGFEVTVGSYTSVQVNNSGGANIPLDAANEPSIAVDPTSPNKIVIGWRQFDTVVSNFREAGFAHTSDGGRTFHVISTPQVLVQQRADFRMCHVLLHVV